MMHQDVLDAILGFSFEAPSASCHPFCPHMSIAGKTCRKLSIYQVLYDLSSCISIRSNMARRNGDANTHVLDHSSNITIFS
mmetsp:Transcript_24644/g.37446  ORF Transcript_24644/g.37446 Transcript_24644/m.37446 type:complete len:81 (+) Transcript_24644:165-407(+)